MGVLQSTLRLSLIDTVSGPAKAISATLGRLRAAAAQNAEALNQMRGRMIDSVGMGYALARSLSAPLKDAAAFETQLEDIGQKAAIPRERLAALGAQLRQVGRQTNQAGSDIAEGMDALMGLGASETDALKLLPDIGKAATAYRASILGLSNAGYAALDNLKVPANQFGKALDAMAQAGKAGAFELKDMSQYFPALGAGYQALGQTGVPAVADLAAALQIVRKGAGDSSEAANNLKNVIQKIKAPQTIKAFKGMGVNLEKELTKATKRGLSPIEAIAEITGKTLKGDLSKMGDLFSDAQVQAGLRPLIQNMDLYRQIRADAMKAQGVVQEDYDRRIRTGQGALLRMKATIEALSVSVGSALLPALSSIIDTIAPIVTRAAELAEQFPRVTAAIIGTTAAVIGLRVALTGLQFVGLFAKGGLIAAATGFARIGGAMLALINPVKLVRNVFLALRVAMISTGVGAIVVAVAAGGLLICNNWRGLSTMFTAFGSSFRNAIEPIIPIIRPVIDGARQLYESVSALLGPVDGLGQSWFAMGRNAGRAMGEMAVSAVQLLVDLPHRLASIDWSALQVSARGAVANLLTGLRASITSVDWGEIGRSVVAGINRGVAATVSSVSAIREAIVSSIGSIDWTSVGRTMSSGIIGLYDAVIGGIRAMNWGGAGEAIGSSIRAAVVGAVDIVGALRAAWWRGGGGAGIALTIGTAIRDGLVGFDWLGVGRSVVTLIGAGLRAQGQFIGGIIKGLFKVDLTAIGADIVQSLWNGIQRKFDELIAWAKNIGARLRSAIGVTDMSNTLGGRVGAMMGAGASNPKPSNDNAIPSIAGARARGGSVKAGSTYQVNENGTELFTPDRNGVISPHEAYRAAMAGSSQTATSSVGDRSVVVHLQMQNRFAAASDPRAVAAMAQQTADAVRSAVEASFGD
jgi:TP901 family phage tail tape measure protein